MNESISNQVLRWVNHELENATVGVCAFYKSEQQFYYSPMTYPKITRCRPPSLCRKYTNYGPPATYRESVYRHITIRYVIFRKITYNSGLIIDYLYSLIKLLFFKICVFAYVFHAQICMFTLLISHIFSRVAAVWHRYKMRLVWLKRRKNLQSLDWVGRIDCVALHCLIYENIQVYMCWVHEMHTGMYFWRTYRNINLMFQKTPHSS